MKKNIKKQRLTVIDFFCGAGGFSEGFRRAGFDVIMGIDIWEPAVFTHNINHGLFDKKKSILDFKKIEEIDLLPDSDVIIGSPPCQTFSLSNHGGNANKDTGVELILVFLKIVAVKKHKKNSKLKAWLMENVPNSRNSVKERYTFLDLDLEDWAKNNGINPEAIALHVKNNGDILHSDDYGAAQTRKRFVCGEITRTGLFPAPTKLNQQVKSLKMIFENFPKPLSKINQDYLIPDPNYPDELISTSDITDHYYDTGIYRVQWQRAKDLKLMHPYMGKMSFPENFDKPSRTIMATQSASTRESIIYPSEISRKGDGEFRLPTIREAATIMGYPLDYQFYGDESTKWRLVGNAVCVQLSYALALEILKKLKHSQLPPKYIDKNLKQFNFLDNHKEKVFNNPPKRSEKALFRHFPIKSGNMTVDLTNKINGQIGTWGIIAHSGTGKGFSSILIDSKHQEEVMNILLVILPEIIDIVRKDKLIKKYTNSYFNTMNRSYGFFGDIPDHPYMLIEHIRNIISELIKIHGDKEIDISGMRLAKLKSKIPFSQVISIYLLSILIFGEK